MSSYLAFPPLLRPRSGRSGIFLLHLSWGHPRRALPVILALWSPDFPHARAFALGARLFGLLGFMILPAAAPVVNRYLALGLNFPPKANIIVKLWQQGGTI